MTTTQNRRHGSARSSTQSQIFKNDKSSSKNNDQISKYFTTSKPTKEPQTTDHLDSPYKNSLSDIKIVTENDDPSNDFRTPKPIKVQKKRSATLRQTKIKSSFSKTKSTTKNNAILKSTQDNFGSSDMNPDHLQMAIALSKSTYAVEYPEHSKDMEDGFSNFLSPEKIPKGRTTLERYGFKSNKPKVPVELKREYIELPKRNKNSKFRFITPTLKTRTVEERESIIATKISMILNSNKNPCEEPQETQNVDELYSDMLKNFKKNCSIFAANGIGLDKNDMYYKNSLNISPTRSKCGCLLKKWEDIPGRENSPIRERFNIDQTSKNNMDITGNDTEIISVCSSQDYTKSDSQTYSKASMETCSSSSTKDSQNLSVEYHTNRDCISPDLFESEDECEYIPKSPDVMDDDYSQSLLSPSKKPRSLQADSFENTPKTTSFKTDSYSESKEMSQRSSSPIMRESSTNVTRRILEYSDEDTEVLYTNSLKEREEFIISLTQSSPATISKENTPKSPEDKPQRIDEFVIDLTLSSEDDLSNHHTTDEKDNSPNTTEAINTNLSEGSATKSTKDCDTEMSPLFLKDSEDILESEKATDFSSAFADKSPLCEVEQSRHLKSSFKISFGLDDCNSSLNVTDYITQMLNQNEDEIGPSENLEDIKEDRDLKSSSQDGDDDFTSSQESCSKESIVISDEELNYSSVQSKDTGSVSFCKLADSDENKGNGEELMDIDEVYRIHSALRNKYKNMSYPIHNRISELRGNSPLAKTPHTATLEDPFNDSRGDSNISKELENNANQAVIVSPSSGSKHTPEKMQVSSKEKVTTPENNLIIKTSNITPLANYDEMDTPGVVKELHKYGLKPLKRQRGVKLLKYLYKSTHPVVVELSSDEDDQVRVVKKRKKSNRKCGNISSTEVDLRCAQNGVEIVGDALLKSEDIDELIFERKFSVKIHSCRIPLQIVWHNFLSQNPNIKESILLYEPLQLEVMHSMLKEQTGCKFHIQDLLTFFDRKCITIRTAQGSQRKAKF